MKYSVLFVIVSSVILAGCSLQSSHPTPHSWSTLPAADEMTIHSCLMWNGPDCGVIMNPANSETYGAAIKSVCDTMHMPTCDPYLEKISTTTTTGSTSSGHTMNHADMVTSEFDFISLMIPHHQEAVDSTQSLLNITQNTELKTLGQEIITAQTKEIAMMTGWLATWYSGETYEGMPYMPMMRDSRALSAITTIERWWMEDMIAHHQWAIDMAHKLLQIMDKQDPIIRLTAERNAFRQDLRKFANDIITVQQSEIDQMRKLLGN